MIKNLKQFFFVAGLLVIAAGAQPAHTAFWQWSTTAATNATADPSINWAEGMSPSSVNDSARAMMAVLAVNAKDTSGTLSTSGTTSNITLATNTVFPNLTALDGQRVAFLHAITGNAAGATLNIDGTGAVPIYNNFGVPVPADQMLIGGIYSVTYFSSVNQYRLHSIFNDPYNVPLGGIVWSTISTPPNANFVAPSGQCISTTTYNAYWVAMGSPASGACPGGQFAIIDMRGRVPAALDTLNASAANRLTSAGTGCGTAMTSVGAVCANGAESHVQSVAEMATHAHAVNDPGHIHATVFANSTSTTFGSGNQQIYVGSVNAGTVVSNTNSNTTGISINNTGSAQAAPQVQPTIGLIPYLRIL